MIQIIKGNKEILMLRDGYLMVSSEDIEVIFRCIAIELNIDIPKCLQLNKLDELTSSPKTSSV